MKFSEMPYARPDLDAVKQQFADLRTRLESAKSYAEAREIFLEEETLNKHVDTAAQLASVRNSIDTRDKFYDEEMNFWNEAIPQLQECQNAWSQAMLASPFRKEFEAEYGSLMFVNAEIADKAFSPAILDEMAQENKVTTEYGKLIASAQIPFEGGVYTLSQLSPFKNDPDDARRLPGLFSGALITETLFSIPGIGYISYQSMVAGDIPFTMFYLSFMAVLTLASNLLTDILYGVVDPRVRIS